MLRTHHAPAELGRNRPRVLTQHRVQPLPCRRRRGLDLSQRRANGLEPGHEALVQQLFLVRDVVIDRGFGDFERGCNVIERGVVETVLVEGPCGGTDHGIPLHRVIAQPLPAFAPG